MSTLSCDDIDIDSANRTCRTDQGRQQGNVLESPESTTGIDSNKRPSSPNTIEAAKKMRPNGSSSDTLIESSNLCRQAAVAAPNSSVEDMHIDTDRIDHRDDIGTAPGALEPQVGSVRGLEATGSNSDHNSASGTDEGDSEVDSSDVDEEDIRTEVITMANAIANALGPLRLLITAEARRQFEKLAHFINAYIVNNCESITAEDLVRFRAEVFRRLNIANIAVAAVCQSSITLRSTLVHERNWLKESVVNEFNRACAVLVEDSYPATAASQSSQKGQDTSSLQQHSSVS